MLTWTWTLTATWCTYSLTTQCSRISVLLLYRRVLPTHRLLQATWAVGNLSLIWCTVAILTDAFSMSSVKCRLQTSEADFRSMHRSPGVLSSVIDLNILLDVIVLSIPLCMTWRLQLGTQQKLSLSAILLLGGLVCIASIMRSAILGDLRTQELSCILPGHSYARHLADRVAERWSICTCSRRSNERAPSSAPVCLFIGLFSLD